MKKYFQLVQNGSEADIYIFGDITSWEWFDSDVSSFTLSRELQTLDAETINVHINSYGGEVAEGLAIYNMLRNHKAQVRTYCDGFACSVASVVFMAGDERIMNEASLLMIHNAWMYTAGNADQLRKDADDLDIITQASIAAYMSRINITEDELKELLDAETWLLPSDALEKGFATSIEADTKTNNAAASARKALFSLVENKKKEPVVNIRITDLPELQSRLADMSDALDALNQQNMDAPQENKTIKFLNALLSGKE